MLVCYEMKIQNMKNPEQFNSGDSERELSDEEKLELAKELVSNYYQKDVDKAKGRLEKAEASIREKLHESKSFQIIDILRLGLKISKSIVKDAKKGNFFDKIDSLKKSIYADLKMTLDDSLAEMDVAIEDDDKEKMRMVQEKQENTKNILNAIEATEEFKEFKQTNE